MQINKIQSNNNPNFKSLDFRYIRYVDSKGISRESQNTTGARKGDLDYDEFARILKRRFDDSKKINIRLMNVSDGTEAYLIANSILKVFGKKEAEERIFPIHTGDISSFVIDNYGKQGIIALTEKDKLLFGENFEKFFKEIPFERLPIANYPENSKAYELNPEFKKYFNFYTEDFQKTLKTLPKDEGNTVISIRNCLLQSFNTFERWGIILKISQILKNASLFIIGDFDRKSLLEYLDSRFKEVGKNIFGLKNYVEPILTTEVTSEASAESIITPIIKETKNTAIQHEKRSLTKMPFLSKLKALLKLK